MAIVTLVLSIVLGAGTVAGTTTAIIGWSQAKKAEKLDQEIKDWKRDEYTPFKSEFDTLKGQILAELKGLSSGQDDLKRLLQNHMSSHR